MMDIATFWHTIQMMKQSIELAPTLHPIVLAALAAPCLLAVAYRSFTSFLISVLLVLVALVALRGSTEEPARWILATLTCLAGLLAVAEAIMIRRARRRIRDLESSLSDVRGELSDTRRKYDSEVYWRLASDRVDSQTSSGNERDPAGGRAR